MILTTLVVLNEKLPLLSVSESGESMSQSLCNERDNKTVVLVSHRKSTMGITDKTYCINNQTMS